MHLPREALKNSQGWCLPEAGASGLGSIRVTDPNSLPHRPVLWNLSAPPSWFCRSCMYQTSANAELIQCTVNDWGCLSSSFSKVIVEIAIAFQIYNPISYPSIRSLWSKTRSGMPHARQLRDWRSQLRLDPVWTSNHLKLGMPWSEWSQNCCCFFLPLFSSAQLFAIPTPIEGEDGGGQNHPVEFHFFCLETLGSWSNPSKGKPNVSSFKNEFPPNFCEMLFVAVLFYASFHLGSSIKTGKASEAASNWHKGFFPGSCRKWNRQRYPVFP